MAPWNPVVGKFHIFFPVLIPHKGHLSDSLQAQSKGQYLGSSQVSTAKQLYTVLRPQRLLEGW